MTASGSDEINGATFKITWKEVTSSRLDSKALKAAAPDLWDRFSKTTTSRRFVIA
jgi:predicted phage-related endonuclease